MCQPERCICAPVVFEIVGRVGLCVQYSAVDVEDGAVSPQFQSFANGHQLAVAVGLETHGACGAVSSFPFEEPCARAVGDLGLGSVAHGVKYVVVPVQQFHLHAREAFAGDGVEHAAVNRAAFLCGGTGLYIESVLYKGNYLSPDSDESLRRRLAERSAQENYSELMRVDPESAASVHPNNVKRVIRALEIYMLSGKTKTEWDREDQRSHMRSGAKLFVLYCRDRDELYRRIDERVDVMMKIGLLDEVKSLMPFSSGSTAAQAIGYKELAGVLLGTKDLCEAVDEVKKASRNYAKRQLSWWRRNKDAIWVDTLSYKSVGDMADVLMSQINAD